MCRRGGKIYPKGRRAAGPRRAGGLEVGCWVLAVVLILPFAASVAVGAGYQALASAADPAGAGARQASPASSAGMDQADWSESRRAAFERFLGLFSPPMIGALHIPSRGRWVPIFEGESDVNMTLGAAWLTDTSPLEGTGNIGLSAHRDGPFRVLKDVAVGDELVLRTEAGERRFVVRQRRVVAPDAVEVLHPTERPALTLITCHPIYFVGSAPNRLVLRAEATPVGSAVALTEGAGVES